MMECSYFDNCNAFGSAGRHICASFSVFVYVCVVAVNGCFVLVSTAAQRLHTEADAPRGETI